jgi:hypothetical protein
MSQSPHRTTTRPPSTNTSSPGFPPPGRRFPPRAPVIGGPRELHTAAATVPRDVDVAEERAPRRDVASAPLLVVTGGRMNRRWCPQVRPPSLDLYATTPSRSCAREIVRIGAHAERQRDEDVAGVVPADRRVGRSSPARLNREQRAGPDLPTVEAQGFAAPTHLLADGQRPQRCGHHWTTHLNHAAKRLSAALQKERVRHGRNDARPGERPRGKVVRQPHVAGDRRHQCPAVLGIHQSRASEVALDRHQRAASVACP